MYITYNIYVCISFSVSTIQQFLKLFSEIVISVDVCAWTPNLGISVYNFCNLFVVFDFTTNV